MIRTLAPAAAILLLSSTILAQAQTPPMSAEDGWSAVARCSKEDSARARHDCLDRVLREAGLLTEAMRAQQQRRAFGFDNEPAPPPAPPAPARGTSAAPSASAPQERSQPVPAPAPSPPPAQPDRLDVEIASVQRPANGRLQVTTTEGAVWRQTESVEMPIPPSQGDRMTIRRGVAGGYRCSVARTNLTFRCERSR